MLPPSPMNGAERLGRASIWRYAIGSLATGGFSTLPGLVLLYYLTDTLAVPAIVGGIVIGVVKVWDVVADPVIGALSDTDAAATGSRRRFLTIGAIALPVCFILTFAVPAGTPVPAAAGWVGIAFFGAATAFSVFQVPYIALPTELAQRYDERTRLLTARVVVLTIGILVFGGAGPALRSLATEPHLANFLMAVVCAVLLAASCAIAVGSAPRRPRSPAQRPSLRAAYTAAWDVLAKGTSLRAVAIPFFLQAVATGTMLAAAQYVATHVIRSEAAITGLFLAMIAPAVLAAPIWQRLSVRTSKRFAYQLASVVFIVACVTLMPALIAPDAWVYVAVAVAGFGYAGMQSLPMAMLPDVMEHDRRRSGVDRAGVIGGVWTALETTGFAFGGMVLATLLALSGYVSSTGGTSQPQSVAVVIALAFSAAPAALVLVSLFPLRGYRLDRAYIDGGAHT